MALQQAQPDRFGDRVLGAPPARGINWLVYVIPPAAILGGVLLVYTAFKNWRKASIPVPASTLQPGETDYIRKLEAQLKARDE